MAAHRTPLSEFNVARQSPAGFPNDDAVQQAYDEADLNRAVQAYRFFYPTVSGAAILKGNNEVGVVENKIFGILDTKPRHVGFTLNSDTPYGPVQLDLRTGPFVIELPAGPLIGAALDINQRWIADIGIPGPDEGKGGKHLILPPDYKENVPDGYYVWNSATNRVIIAIRSLPVQGDVTGAIERLQTIKIHPLNPPAGWSGAKWVDLTEIPQDTTPVKWEKNIKFWEVLHEVIETEPAVEGYRNNYGELAALGIAKGKPFAPDARMKRILEMAAKTGLAQMQAYSFADRRPDRIVWKDRKWEWAALRYEDGFFNTPNYVDLEAREVWFYQAIGTSPAMFRRKAGFGSLYWLGLRDNEGGYLDGGNTYKLTVPQPVPAKLFWSVTVYDAETRSQVAADQGRAALRSMFELNDKLGEKSLELYFGPKPPTGKEGEWIQTIPGKGSYVYFRIYGPERPSFDGSWKPADFEELK